MTRKRFQKGLKAEHGSVLLSPRGTMRLAPDLVPESLLQHRRPLSVVLELIERGKVLRITLYGDPNLETPHVRTWYSSLQSRCPMFSVAGFFRYFGLKLPRKPTLHKAVNVGWGKVHVRLEK